MQKVKAWHYVIAYIGTLVTAWFAFGFLVALFTGFLLEFVCLTGVKLQNNLLIATQKDEN